MVGDDHGNEAGSQSFPEQVIVVSFADRGRTFEQCLSITYVFRSKDEVVGAGFYRDGKSFRHRSLQRIDRI